MHLFSLCECIHEWYRVIFKGNLARVDSLLLLCRSRAMNSNIRPGGKSYFFPMSHPAGSISFVTIKIIPQMIMKNITKALGIPH